MCGSNTRARATFTRTRFLVYGFRLLGGAFFAGAHVTGTRRAGPAKPLPERWIDHAPLNFTYLGVIVLRDVDHAPTNKLTTK